MTSPAPGYYWAQGDPPGTVRQWDGTQWVSGPMPAQPGGVPPPPHAPPPIAPTARAFGYTVPRRLGAAAIDIVIVLVVIVPLQLAAEFDWLRDVWVENSWADPPDRPGNVVRVPILIFLGLGVVCTRLGWTPGKRLFGLRIRSYDPERTTPAWWQAAVRMLVWTPVLIPLDAWFTLQLIAAVQALTMHFDKAEERSLADRLARTRVRLVTDDST